MDQLQSHVWGRASYYTRKYAKITIYEEAVGHIWLCNCSILNFLIYEENLIFFFISVLTTKNENHLTNVFLLSLSPSRVVAWVARRLWTWWLDLRRARGTPNKQMITDYSKSSLLHIVIGGQYSRGANRKVEGIAGCRKREPTPPPLGAAKAGT